MAALAIGMLAAEGALCAEIDTGSGASIRWDNTVRSTLGVRTGAADPALLADPNADDGDRAFAPGVNSGRLDLLSEFDASLGPLGVDLSAAAWYDPVYFQPTANRSPDSFNPPGVSHTSFPGAVRRLLGADVDLLNANVHDRFTLADHAVTVRVGRQSLLWGESLFSTENGVAAGQAPVDGIKAASQPLAEAKELFLPVAQATVDVALLPGVHLEAYGQGEFRRDRQPGVGSYFSTVDFADVGGGRLFTGPPGAPTSGFLRRGPDHVPPGLGQFGGALHIDTGGLDLGLYALRFDAKAPQFTLLPAVAGTGRYGLVFPSGIALYGASFSTYLGDSNLGGEISLRSHMPLVSGFPTAVTRGASSYAVGTTAHAQISLVSVLAPGRLWQGATLMAELVANQRLSIDRDAAALAPGRNRFALSGRMSFEPQYFQVLPQLDLTVPVGFGWNMLGNSSVLADQVAQSADLEAGVSATWQVVWYLALTYTRFVGSPAHQPLADRDFLALSVSRTF